MKLFYSKECALHNPEFEILSGKAVPYLESPDRMARIMSHLSRAMGWSWEDVDTLDSVESSKDAIEAVKRVHSPDYIEYLRDAYESWVRDGGSKVCRIWARGLISRTHSSIFLGSSATGGISTSWTRWDRETKDDPVSTSFTVGKGR